MSDQISDQHMTAVTHWVLTIHQPNQTQSWDWPLLTSSCRRAQKSSQWFMFRLEVINLNGLSILKRKGKQINWHLTTDSIVLRMPQPIGRYSYLLFWRALMSKITMCIHYVLGLYLVFIVNIFLWFCYPDLTKCCQISVFGFYYDLFDINFWPVSSAKYMYLINHLRWHSI